MTAIAVPTAHRGSVAPMVPLRARTWFVTVLGLGLAGLVIGGTLMIILSFSGSFTQFVPATVDLPFSSTAVQVGSPVEYRDVTVGKVVGQGTQLGGGLVAVTVHIQPGRLAAIPSDVRATVAPVSIFGNQFVVLVAPAHPATTAIRSGATIPPLQTNATASLQNTLGDLDHLLIALDPAKLDTALTALAGALQGQGNDIGNTLVAGHSYLDAVLPLWPTVVADLQTLVPVADQIAASTPDIVSIFGNSEAPSATVTAAGPQIQQLFSNGATLSNQANQLLGTIQQPFQVLTAASGPFLNDISANPKEISQLLSGLATWASTWAAAEASGPYLKLTATVNVLNPADLGLALLGGPLATTDLSDGLGASLVNPPTYTAAQAPHFAASSASLLAEPSQQAAVSQVVAASTGQAPSSPAVASLLLSPVLQHLVSP